MGRPQSQVALAGRERDFDRLGAHVGGADRDQVAVGRVEHQGRVLVDGLAAGHVIDRSGRGDAADSNGHARAGDLGDAATIVSQIAGADRECGPAAGIIGRGREGQSIQGLVDGADGADHGHGSIVGAVPLLMVKDCVLASVSVPSLAVRLTCTGVVPASAEAMEIALPFEEPKTSAVFSFVVCVPGAGITGAAPVPLLR